MKWAWLLVLCMQTEVRDFKVTVDPLAQTDYLLIFSTEWCGPCKLVKEELKILKKNGWDISPLHEWEGPKDDIIPIFTIDVDDYPELGIKYNIEAIPTFISVKDGKIHKRAIGHLDRWKIRDFMK